MMKADYNKPARLIAAYGLEEKKLSALSVFCDREGIRLRLVLPDEADRTVAELCSSYAEEYRSCSAPPDGECLIFAGFDRGELSAAVDGLRENGIKVPLKAIATPSNLGWPLSALLTELAREHDYMSGRGGAK